MRIRKTYIAPQGLWDSFGAGHKARARSLGILPPAAGGIDPPSPVAFPLGAPTITGTTVTVDQALQQPSVVLRTIADLSMQRFFADRIFSAGGGVEGGAVLYERPNAQL